MASDQANPIILYDGVCALCNRLVQFVLKHDSQGRFRFASMQGGFAMQVLQKHGANPQLLDTMYVVVNYRQPTEGLLSRSEAALAILQGLGGFWAAVAVLLRILPNWFRNWGYNLIARNRYRVFGKYDACPLPEEKDRGKFLDV